MGDWSEVEIPIAVDTQSIEVENIPSREAMMIRGLGQNPEGHFHLKNCGKREDPKDTKRNREVGEKFRLSMPWVKKR